MSLSVSLRMRTRQRSTLLIEINESSSSFFKMQISHGRVIVLYNLLGESGIVFPGKVVLTSNRKDLVFSMISQFLVRINYHRLISVEDSWRVSLVTCTSKPVLFSFCFLFVFLPLPKTV